MKQLLSTPALALALGLALASCGATGGTAEPKVVPYQLDHCLVMTDVALEGDGITYTHDGHELRFCCDVCVDMFEEDPERYMADYHAALANKD